MESKCIKSQVSFSLAWDKIVELFNYNKDPDNIVIDFSNLHVGLFRCNCYFKNSL